MKKICLLYGGTSTEREVSLSSHKKIHDVLCNLGYEVVDIDPSDGIANMVKILEEEKPDCVFNGLYGGFGESGEIQGLLNMMKIPYTHSGSTCSFLAMDKGVSAMLFEKHGIPSPKTYVIDADDIYGFDKLPFPYVIKPVCGGSSVGVFIINSKEDLLTMRWTYGQKMLVQEYINGQELTVGVLNGEAVAVTEIVPKVRFYDYEVKYSQNMAEHILPAKISPVVAKKMMKYAEDVYKIFDCRTLVRVDFRYDSLQDRICILELNTQPGMTEFSLFPEQASYIGIPFEKLIEVMVNQACYDS